MRSVWTATDLLNAQKAIQKELASRMGQQVSRVMGRVIE